MRRMKRKSNQNEGLIEIGLEESKKIQVEILSNIAKFCNENNLNYYLAYGTLIGAIRHKGFIPWDDDTDIWMPRKDYEIFLKNFNGEGRYKVINPKEKIARHSFAKVIDTQTIKIEPNIKYEQFLGIDVDVFPIDGAPSCLSESNKFYKKLKKIYTRFANSVLSPISNNLIRNCRIIFKKGFFVKRRTLLKKAEILHKQYPYESCEYVACYESAFNSIKNRVLKEDFEDFILVKFEGLDFRAPIGYDRILKNIYGDYMQLPPKEQQITHHSNKTYWR